MTKNVEKSEADLRDLARAPYPRFAASRSVAALKAEAVEERWKEF